MPYAPEIIATPSLGVPHACVVTLPDAHYGSLDAERLARVHRLLLDQADKPNARFLIVDCSAIHYFGARFAGVLVDTWDRLRRSNRQLVLCGLTPYCTKLLQILHLDRLFVLYSTEQVALQETARHDQCGNRAPSSRVWMRKTEVAWDGEMIRLAYIGDDGIPIRSIIVPRRDADEGKESAP
jgi:anti-anti-sigma factor